MGFILYSLYTVTPSAKSAFQGAVITVSVDGSSIVKSKEHRQTRDSRSFVFVTTDCEG